MWVFLIEIYGKLSVTVVAKVVVVTYRVKDPLLIKFVALAQQARVIEALHNDINRAQVNIISDSTTIIDI